MTKREDERGHIVRVFERGDGMRRRFYDALEDSRFSYPRKSATKHAFRWYCDGHLGRRPVSGLWACSTLAEHLLARSRECGSPSLKEAASFFAATRRAMRHMLAHYKVTTRLTRPGVDCARRMYSGLCKQRAGILAGMGYLTPTAAM